MTGKLNERKHLERIKGSKNSQERIIQMGEVFTLATVFSISSRNVRDVYCMSGLGDTQKMKLIQQGEDLICCWLYLITIHFKAIFYKLGDFYFTFIPLLYTLFSRLTLKLPQQHSQFQKTVLNGSTVTLCFTHFIFQSSYSSMPCTYNSHKFILLSIIFISFAFHFYSDLLHIQFLQLKIF